MLKKAGMILGIIVLIPFSIFMFNHVLWVSESTIQSENERIEIIRNNSDSIVCILKVNKRKYKLGEVPDIEVEIINKTDSSLLMVGSLDGSSLGFRLPISKLLVRHQFFGFIDFLKFGCANVNELREQDFKRVESNKSFNPYERSNTHDFFPPHNLDGMNFLLPGIYTLKYRYSTKTSEDVLFSDILQIDSSLIAWYLEEGEEENYYKINRENELLDSLWRLVPKIELESNPITIEYGL